MVRLGPIVGALWCAATVQPVVLQAQTIPQSVRTAVQDTLAARGMTASNDQIADALRRSGMSEAQVRERLRSAGYDPSLADSYFGSSRGGTTDPTGSNATEFARALQNLGILNARDLTSTQQTQRGSRTDSILDEADRRAAATRRDTTPEWQRVFGKDVFSRSTTSFDPSLVSAVDPSYRLGAGDVLQLVVTGQVEFAYQLDVRKDGSVVIPQVGQVPMVGLTLEAARASLAKRMARSYSGIGSGEAHVDLSVARIRTVSVQVIGEVERPGSYPVSAMGTVFHALSAAGGPSSKGSFRSVQLRRAGKLVGTLDLYDYLLRGVADGDVRLEQGDVIFVPLATRAVGVRGAIRRVAQYELKDGEGLADLVRYAGGTMALTAIDRVQIDRVLPPTQRSPGFERVSLDVGLSPDGTPRATTPLLDQDQVIFFPVGETRRNVVTIGGEVFRPGIYQFTPNLTLGQLVDRAQGFLPWAVGSNVKVVRRRTSTGTAELRAVDATTDAGRGFALAEFDTVEVLDGRSAIVSGEVTVSGAINGSSTRLVDGKPTREQIAESFGPALFGKEFYGIKPGPTNRGGAADVRVGSRTSLVATDSAYAVRERGDQSFDQTGAIEGLPRVVRPFVEHESIKDAIDRAGGLRIDADRIELFRRRAGRNYSDTTSVRYDFTVGPNLTYDERAMHFFLEPDDRIVVRSSPGFRTQRFVTMTGEFEYQGDFAITEGVDRVGDLIKRAGGLRPGAYPRSFRLLRGDKAVGIDLGAAMRGDASANIPLLAGDRMSIGRDPQTVLVQGAVARMTLVHFEPGLHIQDYIERAGGPKEVADVSRAWVEYASGATHRDRKRYWLFPQNADVQSGSTITVPERLDDHGAAQARFAMILSTISAVGSILVAYAAFKR